MLDPGSKVIWVNDVVMGLQELELLPEDFRLHQISVEKSVSAGMVCWNNAMVVHDRATTDWRDAVEASGVMQSRIDRVLQ